MVSENSSQLPGTVISSFDIKYNAGKLWGPQGRFWEQTLSSPVFLSSSSHGTVWLNRVPEHQRKAGPLARFPGPDLLFLVLDPWLPLMLSFHSKSRDPEGPNHLSGNPTLEGSVTTD